MAKEWEDAPSANGGWEDAPDEKLNKQVSKLGDVVGGLAETAVFGTVNQFADIGAGVYGSLKGMMSPDITAKEGWDQEQAAYRGTDFGQAMSTPLTNTRKNIEDFLGKKVEEFKEDMGTLAGGNPNLPQDGLYNDAKRGFFAAMSAAPEITTVTPFLGGKKGSAAKAPTPSKADALIAQRETTKNVIAEPADRPTLPVTPEGQAILTPEDAMFKAEAERKAALVEGARPVPDRNMADPFGQMKQQLGVDQRLPTPESPALARMVEDLQNPVTPEQRAAQAAIEARQAALEQGVARNVDLNEHGPNRTTLSPEHQLRETAQERMDFVQDANRGANVIDRTAQGVQQELPDARMSQVGPEARPETIITNMLKEDAGMGVLNHPMVKKSLERVEKAEVLYLKAAEQFKQGRVTQAQLKRLERDLEGLRAAAERSIANHTRSKMGGVGKKQGGAIDPDVFKEGFQKLKQLSDGTWLRAHSDGQSLTIEAIKDSRKLGGALFEKTDKWSEPSQTNMAATMVGSKQKGMATEIYKFASELGNDIQPSKIRTKEGSAMWDRFHQKGIAQDGVIKSPGNKQAGAIFLNPKQHDKLKDVGAIEKILGPIAPSKMTAADAIEIGKNAPDMEQNLVQKGINYFTKGGLYQAIKTKNPVVRFGVEKITEADRLSRADVQHYVHDKLAPAFRDMSNAEQRDVWKIIDHADKTQKPFTREELAAGGFSEKQIAAVETHREVMDRAFESMNAVRSKLGMDPVNRREAYAAMNASGDYRMVVKKDGNIVGMIGRNDRYSADVLAERLANEGYEIGERHYIGSVPHERGGAQTALLQALDFLAKDDPRLKELLLKADEVMKNEAYGFLNMKKHTLEKKGVFGMQGRKTDLLWDYKKQERLNDLNAKEGLQAQVAYAEMALKWEHLTNAAVDIKEVLKSPELVDKQHFAKKWVEEHLQNALGYNPDALGRSLENALSYAFDKTGFGFSYGRQAIAGARKVVNTSLLGLSPGFWASNVIQPLASLPAMKASLIAKGLRPDFDFGTGYSYLARAGITDMRRQLGKMNDFEKQMHSYATSHHVFGSDLIEHSNRVRKDALYRAEQVGNFVAGGIESMTRRNMFYTFAHMLNDNGMSVKNGLFEAAHNLTDLTMNNYSAVERPRIYNTMGPVGDMSANLASFKHNEISRIAMYARQISEDKSARPLLVSLASQVAFAGITGTLAFQEADQLYKLVTKLMGTPDSLSLRVMKMSEKLGKQVNEATGAKKGKVGDASYVASHGGFSALGVDLSKRLGIGDAVADNLGDAAFPGGSKLVDMAGSAWSAATNPSEINTKRMVREFSPAIATGAEDLTWFSKENGNLPVNRKTLEAQPRRTQADKVWKAAGFTGINESVQKGKHYEVEWIKDAYAEKRKGVLERAHGELFTQHGVSEKTIRDYLANEGDIDTLARDMERTLKKQSIPAKDRDLLRSAMSRSITSLRHAQRLQEAFKE